MANQINSIHYAVEIITTYEAGFIPAIGMEDSVIRYITDGVDVSTGYTYEDGSDVTENYYTEFINKKGIKPSNQTIDVISGGAYAFLGSLNIDLLEYDNLHSTFLKTEDLYILGSEMNFYVVIDNVFYNRWSGIVAETKFTDKVFSIQGKDKHNTDNNTIKDRVFGYSNALVGVVDEEVAFIEDVFINKVYPGEGSEIRNSYWNSSSGGSEEEAWRKINLFFNGGSPTGTLHINEEGNYYNIHLNGDYETISAGMFLTVNGVDKLFPITASESSIEDGIVTTKVTIIDLFNTLVDYTQFYGPQPTYVADAVVFNDEAGVYTGTSVASENKLLISIFKKGIVFEKGNGDFVTNADGQYLGTDVNGNRVALDGVLNADGSVTIITTETYDTIKPSSVKYWDTVDDTENPLSFGWKLDRGLVDNLQTYGTNTTLANDFRPDGHYKNNNFLSKFSYYKCTFDEDISGFTPAVMLSALVDSFEFWTSPRTNLAGIATGYGSIIYKEDLPQPPIWIGPETYYPTTYYGVVRSAEEEVYSYFTSYDIEIYEVVVDKLKGEVPFLVSSFSLPNTRSIDKEVYPDQKPYPYAFGVKSTASTNAPIGIIDEEALQGGAKYITTDNNVNNWDNFNKITDDTDPNFLKEVILPSGVVDGFDAPTALNTTRTLLFRISTRGGYGDVGDSHGKMVIDPGTGSISGADVRTIGNQTHGYVGVNTIAMYNRNPIQSTDDITLLTHDTNTDNYVKVIKELSGSTSTFRNGDGLAVANRNLWTVGKQITDETNTFNMVKELCEQGFVAGLTDRKGDVILKEFLEDLKDDNIPFNVHTDDIIKRNSIKAFQLSPVFKCFNEFTVKYHYVNDDYQKSLGVYFVDADEFPAVDEFAFDTNPANTGDVSFKIYNDTVTGSEAFVLGSFSGLGWVDLPLIGSKIRLTTTDAVPFNVEGVVDRYQGGNPLCVDAVYDCAFNTFYTAHMEDIYNSTSTEPLWKTFVVGVNSYQEAKELWEKAHQSWLLNKRIRTADTSITDLSWCIDLNTLVGNNNVDFYTTYQWHYLEALVGWTTRQKFQVTYQLPITTDTIKLNIMDKIEFNDPIITPDTDEGNKVVGLGWLTAIKVNAEKSLLDVTVTFDPDFMSPTLPEVKFGDIWEQGQGTYDDIIEDGTSSDSIIEVGA